MINSDLSLPLHADRPDASEPDLYNRRKFVERLTQAVARRPGRDPFIIGIEGSWGEGKSTVLEYMAQELQAQYPEVTLVRFNPWAFHSQDQLLLGLVKIINEQLNVSHQSKVKALTPMLLGFVGGAAELFGSASGNGYVEKIGAAGKTWADSLGADPSFQTLKSALEKELAASAVKVVVLVDDLDRLDHDAIRSVFRLLKAVVDLPSFTYILAYDPEIVAAALETHFETRGQTSGRRYLEKIVQLPLALPKLDPIDLEEDMQATLVAAFVAAELPLSDEAHQALRELSRLLAQHVTTPREIRRLGNAVQFALPILRGETNPLDVCRIEALRLLFPVEFEKLLRHPDWVGDKNFIQALIRKHYLARTQGFNPLGEALQPDKRSPLYHLFESAPTTALTLLAMTFPAVAAEFDLRDVPTFSGPFPAHELEYIKRYLQYAIPSDDVEDRSVTEFTEQATQDPGAAQQRLKEVQQGKRLERFLSKLTRYGQHLGEEKRLNLVILLAQHFYRQPLSESVRLLGIRNAVIDLLQQAVVHAPMEERWRVMERTLQALPTWWMQLDLFKAASPVFGRADRAQVDQGLKSLRHWMAGVLHAHQTELLSQPRINPVTALVLLAECYGRQTTQQLVIGYLQDQPHHAQHWLLTLAQQVYGSQGPVPSAFSLEQYLTVAELVDMDVMVNILDASTTPAEGFGTDDHAVAWRMLERLHELEPDAQEILRRRAERQTPASNDQDSLE